MNSDIAAALLITYVAVACGLTTAILTATKRKGRWGRVAFTFGLLAFAVALVSYSSPGQNPVIQLVYKSATFNRTIVTTVLTAMSLGVLASMSLVASAPTPRQHMTALVVYSASVAGLSVLTVKDHIGRYLADPAASGTTGLVQKTAESGFVVKRLTELDIAPTSMALCPGGGLYVAGYAGLAFQNGLILRISLIGEPQSLIVARYVDRPHGLAFHDDALYVSRAGQFTRAENGKLIQENTGAVTRLQDLDGDGVFDYHTDVISGLPGARLPDGLHQNNGIVIDKEGNLFVTVGAPSDHGPIDQAFAGTILKLTRGTQEPKVFARGFRNPYGITVSPDGQVFCTDNDADIRHDGDKIIHVVKGGHYGHPYTVPPSLSVQGVVPPILRCSSAQGIAYAPAGSLADGLGDCLYVAAYGDDCVNRIHLIPEGDTYRAELSFVARVPSPTDVVITPEGVIYACSHHERTIYRITAR